MGKDTPTLRSRSISHIDKANSMPSPDTCNKTATLIKQSQSVITLGSSENRPKMVNHKSEMIDEDDKHERGALADGYLH